VVLAVATNSNCRPLPPRHPPSSLLALCRSPPPLPVAMAPKVRSTKASAALLVSLTAALVAAGAASAFKEPRGSQC